MANLVRGIDISSAQTIRSWATLKAALGPNGFVIVKLTEGSSFTSKTAVSYSKAAKDSGVVRGSYHFARPGSNSPAEEAAHYVAVLKQIGFQSGYDLPPFLDIEDDGGLTDDQLTAWCLAFLAYVDGALKLTNPWLKCGVYLNNNFRLNEMNGAKVLEGRVLWLASWVSASKRATGWPTTESSKPAGAGIWQWSDGVVMPGISTVDGDVARLADLKMMAPKRFAADPVAPKPPVPKPPVPKPPVPKPAVSLAYIQPHRTSVAYLQRALNKVVGSDCHGGFFDAKTYAAVRKYQAKVGHPVTGRVTTAEWQALAKALGTFTVKE